MDPITVGALARIYQQEIIDRAANDGWGTPTNKDLQAILDEQKEYKLWRQPRARSRLLAWLRRLFAALVRTLRTVDTRQPGEAVYATDPCAAECE